MRIYIDSLKLQLVYSQTDKNSLSLSLDERIQNLMYKVRQWLQEPHQR